MALYEGTIRTSVEAIQYLRSSIQGSVHTPGEEGFDESRMAWNLSVNQNPALIVNAETASDIAAAVQYAGQQNLGVAVQSTGHGIAYPANGCLLIRTSRMAEVQVDTERRTATVEAGAKWEKVLEKAEAVGLAPLLGSSPDVGVAGYTLGGGMGWLGRKYGLAVDSVNSMDVITADGRQLTISDGEHNDLFWSMRGGGGSFAVLAGMEIKLYPVTTVYAGNLVYAPEDARQVVARYREWIKDLPDEMTSSIVLMNFPPMETVPEMFRGKSFVMVRGCWCGALEEGEQLLSSWRDWKAPVHDFWGELPFNQAAVISNDPVDPVPSFSNGAWMKDLDDGAVETLIDYTFPAGGPPALVFSEVRHAGGAISRVDSNANAYSNREALFNLNMIGVTPTPEVYSRVEAYTDNFLQALEPHLTGGVYMNFLGGENAVERTKAAYPSETFKRLREIKTKYDPGNMFRYGFGIEPLG